MMELNSEDEEVLALILVLKRRIRRRIQRKTKKTKSIWVKVIFSEREQYGDFHTLLQSMKLAARNNFLDRFFSIILTLSYVNVDVECKVDARYLEPSKSQNFSMTNVCTGPLN